MNYFQAPHGKKEKPCFDTSAISSQGTKAFPSSHICHDPPQYFPRSPEDSGAQETEHSLPPDTPFYSPCPQQLPPAAVPPTPPSRPQRLKKPSLVVCSAPKNGTSVLNKSQLQVAFIGGREISDIHIFRLAFFFLAVQSSQIMEGVQSYSFTKVKNTVIGVETISPPPM